MNTTELLSQIDSEISRLQEVRNLLAGHETGNGRVASTPKPAPKRHKMSAEGRARIAEAQRARWAKQKKVAR